MPTGLQNSGFNPLTKEALLVLGLPGLRILPANELSALNIGLKAIGLLNLPRAWYPPFFVIEAAVASRAIETSGDLIAADCAAAVSQCKLGSYLVVRSSGVAETMLDRGKFPSEFCGAADLAQVVAKLTRELGPDEAQTTHWVVQRAITARRKGWLSNSRRFTREPRDWVMEVEQQDGKPKLPSQIALRTWRDGYEIETGPLICEMEVQIGLVLKNAVKFALLSAHNRMHLEWVWSGDRIWIVQRDLVEAEPGIDPRTILPDRLEQTVVGDLILFAPAASHHFANLGKLRNAFLYGQIGYEMPPFYVLSLSSVDDLQTDTFLDSLKLDLDLLTKRPLIIRTDGPAIPKEKREMLPRSDELRSSSEAIQWLQGRFADSIREAGLQSEALCLIAHHFVPAVAAAWARAEPGKRIVRVESLWGLPEGLYWYSHDTFEVDLEAKAGRQINSRLRYKRNFFAADESGQWVTIHVKDPYDWRSSVSNRKWILEIARATRKISELENKAVSVMWFVEVDKRSSRHEVLPWFHTESELSNRPKAAAPRHKKSTSRDFLVEKRSDWETAQRLIEQKRLERITVLPVEADLVRDRQFVEEIANVAVKNSIVIELAGGLLSHAYYLLTSKGAQVECVDLYGAEPEIREFNKLVRDKIPGSIQSGGEEAEVVELKGEAYLLALKQKLVEEAYEVLDAKNGDALIGELADVKEVLLAIENKLNITSKRINAERLEKRKSRGGFERGIVLRRTSTPHSFTIKYRSELDQESTLGVAEVSAIGEPNDIPRGSPYRRPDFRKVGQRFEKIFTFGAALSRLTESPIRQETDAIFPAEYSASRNFVLTIEFSRHRDHLRGTIRLRLDPQQMELDFDQLEFDFNSAP